MNFIEKTNFKINSFFKQITESTMFFLQIPEWFFGLRFRWGLVVVNSFLVVIFVLQIAVSSGTGYELKKLEKKAEFLAMEQQKIEVEITAASSLAVISSKMENSSMVNSPRLKYFKPSSALVAVNSR